MRLLMKWMVVALSVTGLSCASPASQKEVKVLDPGADVFEMAGLSVERPKAWLFVYDEAAKTPGTLVRLESISPYQGFLPSFEISQRQVLKSAPVSDATPEMTPASLDALQSEMALTYDGYEQIKAPARIKFQDRDALRMEIRIDETLPNGALRVKRVIILGILDGSQLWLLRFIGPDSEVSDDLFNAAMDGVDLP